MDLYILYSPQKMHMHPCMRAYATVQKLLCHGNYCELILSPVRASFRLSFADRPLLARQNLLPNNIRSRHHSKSTLAHDSVASAVSHKHHSIIHVGVGLIQFVYGRTQSSAVKVIPSKNLFPPFFPASFLLDLHLSQSHFVVSIFHARENSNKQINKRRSHIYDI